MRSTKFGESKFSRMFSFRPENNYPYCYNYNYLVRGYCKENNISSKVFSDDLEKLIYDFVGNDVSRIKLISNLYNYSNGFCAEDGLVGINLCGTLNLEDLSYS